MKSRTVPAGSVRVPVEVSAPAVARRERRSDARSLGDLSPVAHALLDVAVRLNAADTEEAVARTVTLAATQLCKAEMAGVGRHAEGMVAFDRLQQDGTWVQANYPVPPSGRGSIAGLVMATGRPYRSDDLATDAHSDHVVDARFGFRNQLSVPMVGDGSQVMGVISLYNKADGASFTDADEALAAALALQAAVALERVRSRAQLTEALASLRHAEARYHQLFDDAPVMYVVTRYVDGVLVIEDCNAAFLATLGYERHELLGRLLADCYTRACRQRLAREGGYERALASVVFDEERELLTRHGEAVEVLVRALPDRDAGGQLIGVRAMFVDISERKRADAERAANEAGFRLLFEDNPHPMWVYDRETLAFFEVNDAAATAYGYSRAEFLAMRVADLSLHDVWRGPRAHAHLHEDAGHHTAQTRHQRKDGRLIDVSIVAHPLTFRGRAAALVVANDITERLRTERVQSVAYAIAQAANRSASLADLYRDIHAQVRLVLDARNFYIARYDAASDTVSFPYYVDEHYPDGITATRKARKGLTEYVIRTGAAARLSGAAIQALATEGLIEILGPIAHEWLAAPLRVNGEVTGVVAVQSYEGDVGYDEGAIAFLEFVSEQIALALDRKQAEAALAASEARFRSLAQNASDLVVVLAADGEIRYISPSVRSLLGHTPEEVVGTSAFAWAHPDDLEEMRSAFQLVLGDTAASESPNVHRLAGYRLRHRDQSWRYMDMRAANLLDDPHVGGVVVNLRDTTDRRRLEEQLAYQAYHDALTGLPNRVRFLDRLAHACARHERDGGLVAVLYLDLDGFKVINDSLGHPAGDSLLTVASHRLAAALRPSDTIARFGGDEFAVLLEDVRHPSEALRVATRLNEVLQAPIELGGREVTIAASIGIALGHGDAAAPNDLLREADIALYQAKSQGKARAVIFDPTMNTRVLERLEVETDLRGALERGEFYLLYQPEVDLATGAIVGVEALVRWRHPQRGLVLPGDFIPIAEETSLIVPFGRWVVEEACRQAAAWQPLAAGGDAPFVVAVNLSARQFAQRDLVEHVAETLGAAGLSPQALRLEITESAMMTDMDTAIETLAALRVLGVQLAVDDFGTGYSSLSYLLRFPVDTLKVDRSFVQRLGEDKGATAIVRAVTATAKALSLGVTAEGIETAAQLRQVRALGCRLGQGYYFAPPLSAADLTPLIQSQPFTASARVRRRSR